MKEELLDDDIDFPRNDDESSHEYATTKYRLLALAIDMTIFSIIMKSISTFIGSVTVSSNWTIFAMISAIFYGFIILQEFSNLNGSVGKYVLKLSVFTNKFQKISFIDSLKRTTFKLILVWLYFFYEIFPDPFINIFIKHKPNGFEYFMIIKYFLLVVCFLFFIFTIISIKKDPKHQSWYDKIAGTVVLREINKKEDTERN